MRWTSLSDWPPWLLQTPLREAAIVACRECGLAAYRAGDYEEALKWCAQSRSIIDRGDHAAQNLLVEAMAHHQLGRAGEAKAAFDEALQQRDKAFPGSPSERFAGVGHNWIDWVVIELLRREATRLLELPEEPKTATTEAQKSASVPEH